MLNSELMKAGVCLPLTFGSLVRGREPGGAQRAVGERMSADECKQHDCDHTTFVHSQKCTKLKHIKVFGNFLQSCFWFLLKH